MSSLILIVIALAAIGAVAYFATRKRKHGPGGDQGDEPGRSDQH